MDIKQTCCIKINLPGGVVSAGDLYELLLIAKNAGAEGIYIGNRQQLFFQIDTNQLEDMKMEMLRAEVNYEIDEDQFPNIISSYVSDTIFNTESWIKEGVYKDVFDLFNYKPRLKINLVDRQQVFVPFFSGNLNFITADVNNYWYLYIRFPKTNDIYCWPSLVYSEDIPAFSKTIEKVIFEHKHLFYDQPQINKQDFHHKVTAYQDWVYQPITTPLKLPEFQLPYYEGINRYVNNKYWLGIYRRNELFPINFIKSVCALCLKNRIGQLYTTPWKSLLIKGITETDRAEWGNILNKYRINVRHAANELNWQLENLDTESLELKKRLVKEFEEYDLRTYRLCFAIKMQPKTGLPGSIIVKKKTDYVYDILHTTDFNPNTKDYVFYQESVPVTSLGQQLIELCNYYYSILQDDNLPSTFASAEAEDLDASLPLHYIYQCPDCMSIYDETYGDVMNNIAAGTPFEQLNNYACSVCALPGAQFVKVESSLMNLK